MLNKTQRALGGVKCDTDVYISGLVQTLWQGGGGGQREGEVGFHRYSLGGGEAGGGFDDHVAEGEGAEEAKAADYKPLLCQ